MKGQQVGELDPGAQEGAVRNTSESRGFWATLAGASWDDADIGMLRLQKYGTRNRSVLAGMEAALDFWSGLPVDAVLARNAAMADQLRSGLAEIPGAYLISPTHPELAGPIVTWGLEGVENVALMDAIWTQHRLRVRAVGSRGVRQCCHLYNSPAEIEQTLAVARALA